MRIEQLVYLIEAARLRSINKASENLYITQQSMNLSLKKLEDELNTKLLERTSLGIKLTSNGVIVEKYAQEILEKIQEMYTEIEKNSGKPFDESMLSLNGNLPIYASPAINYDFILKILNIVSVKNTANISVFEMDNKLLKQHILDKNLNDGIYLINMVDNIDVELSKALQQGVFCEKLTTFSVYANISLNHPLSRQKSATIRTILKYPLVLYQQPDTEENDVYDLLKIYGQPNICLTTNNKYLIKNYIEVGKAIGLVGKFNYKDSLHVNNNIVKLRIRDIPEINILCVSSQQYYNKHKNDILNFLKYAKSIL